MPSSTGVFQLSVRLARNGQAIAPEGQAVFQVAELGSAFGAGVGPFSMMIDSAGEFAFEWKIAGSNDPWENLLTFEVKHDPDVARRLGLIASPTA
jgi:hypothetical protein